jgi:hypothetical protein
LPIFESYWRSWKRDRRKRRGQIEGSKQSARFLQVRSQSCNKALCGGSAIRIPITKRDLGSVRYCPPASSFFFSFLTSSCLMILCIGKALSSVNGFRAKMENIHFSKVVANAALQRLRRIDPLSLSEYWWGDLVVSLCGCRYIQVENKFVTPRRVKERLQSQGIVPFQRRHHSIHIVIQSQKQITSLRRWKCRQVICATWHYWVACASSSICWCLPVKDSI